MANICITLPKSVKWSDYEKELEQVKDGKEEMNFRLPTLPKDVHPGDRCYICHDGFVKGWMKITGIGKHDGFNCSTTGKEWSDGVYVSRSGEFHYLNNPIPMKGFQGYRKMDNLNEAFGTNFKFDELDNLPEFEKKVEYCRQKLGPDFGQGSSRIVFDFTDSAVLKLAYNEKGIAQNRAEYEMSKKYPIVTKIFKVGKDYSWILSENVLPCEGRDFDAFLGYSWGDIQEFVAACYNEYGTEHCPCYPMEYDDFEFCLNKSSDADWFNALREYMNAEKIPYGDMIRLSTYGLVKRNNEMLIVILDAGLTQEILNTHYRNKSNMENNELQEEVSVEPFEPKDELNPKFWVDNKLNSKVRMRLLDIADDFVKTLDIRWVKPDDIVLTGSIANYNWTKFSDVDIHIIMDFKKVYEKTDFVKNYFDCKKQEWNSTHEGLKIYGFNVELSVEDKNTPAVASGVYSLEKNDWVSEPKDLSDAKLNKEYVESTAENYIEKIDDLDRRIRKEKDAKKVEKLSDKMVSIFNKLKGMRRDGLKSKAKEMSSGNIIWKILRAEGYIKKIWDIVNYNYDRSMSLNEGVTGKDNKKASALYVYALDKEDGTWHVLCARRKNKRDDDEGGKWNPPMGHVHRGEDMLDGAIRECFEESGVDFDEYRSKVKLMDSHRWGNNYRLVLKDKFTKDFKPGDGDEENDDFIWLPVGNIKEKTWAYTCGENAEKYIPKTITIKEEQKRIICENIDSETITLYHGVNCNRLEFNLENGGFVPRVCAEGGPKAVWLSEKQHPYHFTFKFTFPRNLLGKKLIQQSTVDYTYDDFISFNDFGCELVKTSIYQHGKGFAVGIDLNDIETCKNQLRLLPDIYKEFNERMKEYPLVYEKFVQPIMEALGVIESLQETKHTIILHENQIEKLKRK